MERLGGNLIIFITFFVIIVTLQNGHLTSARNTTRKSNVSLIILPLKYISRFIHSYFAVDWIKIKATQDVFFGQNVLLKFSYICVIIVRSQKYLS